jgi:hypothetical protein
MEAEETRAVQLTAAQIAFMRTSLDYSSRAVREYDYGPADRSWVAARRREQDEMIRSIRQALADRASISAERERALGVGLLRRCPSR